MLSLQDKCCKNIRNHIEEKLGWFLTPKQYKRRLNKQIDKTNYPVSIKRLIYDIPLDWPLKKIRGPWDEYLTSWAAGNGFLKYLKFLHMKNCPWDWKTPLEAAENDQLECLKYAVEKGCYFDSLAISAAAEKGNIFCFDFLVRKSIPWCSFCGTTITCSKCRKNLEDYFRFYTVPVFLMDSEDI